MEFKRWNLQNKFNIDGNTALERVKQYQILAAGNNTTYYLFYKNNILKDIYSLLQHHPTKGGYIDWSITLTCVAAGKVLVDASKLLIYKNNNWFGSQEFINKQACKLYEDCGLGDLGYLMSPLLNALDVFMLIMKKIWTSFRWKVRNDRIYAWLQPTIIYTKLFAP